MPENEPYLSVAIKAVIDSGKLAETISKHFAAYGAASAKTTIAKIHAMTPTHPFGTVLRYRGPMGWRPIDETRGMVIGPGVSNDYIKVMVIEGDRHGTIQEVSRSTWLPEP